MSKLTALVQARFTKTEKDLITAAAKRAGMSMSEWIREKLNAAAYRSKRK